MSLLKRIEQSQGNNNGSQKTIMVPKNPPRGRRLLALPITRGSHRYRPAG